jgi:lysozyme
MTASERCIAGIKQAEGFRACAYRDVAGVWTIGYGETSNVQAGDVITLPAADARLRARVAVCAFDVQQLVRVKLSQGELDALVDFEYNLGRPALSHSTLLAKLNAGDHAGAALEFPRWSKAGGQVLIGLLNRRRREQAWFNQPAQEAA